MGKYYHYKCHKCDYPFFGENRYCPKCKTLSDLLQFRCNNCDRVYWDDTGYCPSCGELGIPATSDYLTDN